MGVWNTEKQKLIDFEIVYDENTKKYQLSADYEEDTEDDIITHCIRGSVDVLNTPVFDMIKTLGFDVTVENDPKLYADFGFGQICVNHYKYKDHVTHKTKKMTVKEIEKALGHPVEIIAEEE